MAKKRSPDSLLTKLELMNVGDQIWTNKSNGYVADNISTIKKQYPDRKYKQNSVYTHNKPLDEHIRLSDFKRIIFVTRIA